jgi:hypothetical protein
MVREKEQNVTAEMARILAGTGVDFVPLFPHVCGERACRVFSDTGEPLMFDRGHFTLSGAITIVNEMAESGALRLQ